MTDVVDTYFEALKAVEKACNFKDDTSRVCPLDDCREMFWHIAMWKVYYAETVKALRYGLICEREIDGELPEGKAPDYYSGAYYQPPAIFRGDQLVIIRVDTHTDGNVFNSVFRLDRECTTETFLRGKND